MNRPPVLLALVLSCATPDSRISPPKERAVEPGPRYSNDIFGAPTNIVASGTELRVIATTITQMQMVLDAEAAGTCESQIESYDLLLSHNQHGFIVSLVPAKCQHGFDAYFEWNFDSTGEMVARVK